VAATLLCRTGQLCGVVDSGAADDVDKADAGRLEALLTGASPDPTLPISVVMDSPIEATLIDPLRIRNMSRRLSV